MFKLFTVVDVLKCRLIRKNPCSRTRRRGDGYLDQPKAVARDGETIAVTLIDMALGEPDASVVAVRAD
jgi:hypothetical protein